jgi:hypothetical protein
MTNKAAVDPRLENKGFASALLNLKLHASEQMRLCRERGKLAMYEKRDEDFAFFKSQSEGFYEGHAAIRALVNPGYPPMPSFEEWFNYGDLV